MLRADVARLVGRVQCEPTLDVREIDLRDASDPYEIRTVALITSYKYYIITSLLHSTRDECACAVHTVYCTCTVLSRARRWLREREPESGSHALHFEAGELAVVAEQQEVLLRVLGLRRNEDHLEHLFASCRQLEHRWTQLERSRCCAAARVQNRLRHTFIKNTRSEILY